MPRSLPDAITFVRHYWNVANEAMRTLDTTRLALLQAPSCGQCWGALDWIRAVRAAGGEIVGGATRVVEISSSRVPASRDRWLVEMRTDEAASHVAGAGRLDKSYPRGVATDLMIVRRRAGRWEVLTWETR